MGVAKEWEFLPGESKDLEIDLVNLDKLTNCKTPHDIGTDGGLKITVDLPGEPDNIILDLTTTPVVVVVDAKLGKIKMALTATETNLMRSGSIVVTWDKDGTGAEIRKFIAASAVRKEKIPEC